MISSGSYVSQACDLTLFLILQEALKVLRLIDDKIIYKLNTSIPTDSFVGEINAEQKCQELYNEVNDVQGSVSV